MSSTAEPHAGMVLPAPPAERPRRLAARCWAALWAVIGRLPAEATDAGEAGVRWRAVAWVAVLNGFCLLLNAVAQGLGRAGEPQAGLLFWTALLVMVFGSALAASRPGVDRLERLGDLQQLLLAQARAVDEQLALRHLEDDLALVAAGDQRAGAAARRHAALLARERQRSVEPAAADRQLGRAAVQRDDVEAHPGVAYLFLARHARLARAGSHTRRHVGWPHVGRRPAGRRGCRARSRL